MALRGPARPHTTQENRRCLHGFAATNEQPQFVLNGLWIWRESLGMQTRHEWDPDGKQMWAVGSPCSSAQGPPWRIPPSPCRRLKGKAALRLHGSRSSGPSLLSCLSPSFFFPSLFSFSCIPVGYVCSPGLCLSLLYLSVSQCLSLSLTTSLTLWQCPSRSVSCSQTVSDSMSVLGLWLALPPTSWLLPKARVLPSMLG